LFEKIIPVYTEIYAKPIKIKSEILIVKAAGTYSYHLAVKG
jgi:hypothetical protein